MLINQGSRVWLPAEMVYMHTATGADLPCGRRFAPAMGSPVAFLILSGTFFYGVGFSALRAENPTQKIDKYHAAAGKAA